MALKPVLFAGPERKAPVHNSVTGGAAHTGVPPSLTGEWLGAAAEPAASDAVAKSSMSASSAARQVTYTGGLLDIIWQLDTYIGNSMVVSVSMFSPESQSARRGVGPGMRLHAVMRSTCSRRACGLTHRSSS